ncbi:MAG: type II toxin-antitoxin system VapC family toxin [Candidatus Magasanikbacteria bacterium]|nr:type II toxin-antitoxin system VapC family toxin [Candidatus Magasanikbacteria bacterium]
MIILDTNAVIYYLQNDRRCVRVIDKLRARHQIAISTITEVELFSFPSLTSAQTLEIVRWLGELQAVPLDSSLARQAAHLRRVYGLKTPDAVVAATAFFFSAPLVTRDQKLNKVAELTIIKC